MNRQPYELARLWQRRLVAVLRTGLVWALAVLTALGVVTYGVLYWAEHRILNETQWMAFAAPLHREPVVSEAVGNYVTHALFDDAEIKQKITDVLSPGAAFLMPLTADQLESVAGRATVRVVGGNEFRTVWIHANRAAHQQIVGWARADQTARAPDVLYIDITTLQPLIRESLGIPPSLLPDDLPQRRAIVLQVNLRPAYATLKPYILIIDFAYIVLPWLILASLFGALALVRNRPRVLMGIGVGVAVLLLLQLIGTKALRPVLTERMTEDSYSAAIGFVYDTLTSTFIGQVYMLLAVLLAIAVGGVLYRYGRSASAIRRLAVVRACLLMCSRLRDSWRQLRLWVRKYRVRLWVAVLVLALAYLALLARLDWRVVVSTIFAALAGIAFIYILSTPPYARIGPDPPS